MQFPDRIFVMNKGEISQSGTPEEIYTNPANEFMVDFIGNYNIFKGEDAEKIFGIKGKTVAVRPESIYVREGEKSIGKLSFKACIKDFMITGNIIRYTVVKNKCRILVDLRRGK